MVTSEKSSAGTRTGAKTQYVAVREYRVIEPSLIRDMNSPEFDPDPSSDFSEEGYRAYLESVQYLFDEYEKTGSIHGIVYRTPEDTLRYRDEDILLRNFRKTFLCAGDSVRVTQFSDGTYTVASNGMHRMYIAKKYGLRLLVYVCDKEIPCLTQ